MTDKPGSSSTTPVNDDPVGNSKSNSNGGQAMRMLADAFSSDDFNGVSTTLAGEDAEFVESRKEQLAKELEEEKKRKLEERKRLLYRIKHGIESDSEKEEDEDEGDNSHNNFINGEEMLSSEGMKEFVADNKKRIQCDIGGNINVSNGNHDHDDEDLSEGSEDENGKSGHDDGIEADLSDGEEDEVEADLSEGEEENTDTKAMDVNETVKDGVPIIDRRAKNTNQDMPTLDAPTLSKKESKEESDNSDDICDLSESESLSEIEKFIKTNSIHDGNGTLLYRHLKSGFDFIYRELKKPKPADGSTASPAADLEGLSATFVESINRMPLVNFIDPTSSITMPDALKRKAWNRARAKPRINSLHIFEKFNSLFRKQGSALTSVAYRNLNTGEVRSIEHLPIRAQMTAPMVVDPTEWHNGPLCHVYIAACTSVEHYRTKVRPSLQAFVNQVDGAGSGNAKVAASAAAQAAKKEYSATKKAGENKREQIAAARKAVAEAKNIGAGANASCQYLIIFVPIRPSSVESDSVKMQQDDPFKGGGLGFRGRFAATRRNQSGDQHQRGRASDLNDEYDEDFSGDNSASSSGVPTFATLSKDHREVYNKFRKDFPNGRACILSSLLDSENNLAPANQVQTQEFNLVLKELGKSVLSGFIERVRRYKEELDRYDKGYQKESKQGDDIVTFDWARYFMIKESLAFTYEQMRLTDDAIRMYDELGNRLPQGAEVNPDNEDASNDIIATMGHVEGFREIVRSTSDMIEISHLTSKYVFARSSLLLFLQKRPYAVLDNLLSYVKKVTMKRGEDSELESDDSTLSLKNKVWAASVCWDARCAAERMTSDLLKDENTSMSGFDAESVERGSCLFQSEKERKDYLLSLCNILSFMRTNIMNLSQSLFPPGALIHKAMAETPVDALTPWAPWGEIDNTSGQKENLQMSNKPLLVSIVPIANQRQVSEWLRCSIKSERHFEDAYIELSDVIVELHTCLNRNRCVSRILAEVAEIQILRGNLDAAVENLLKTIDVTAKDPWDRLLSWRVFRLLCCQRKLKNEPEYFKSLTYCLGSRLSRSIPQKLRSLLHEDLQALVGVSSLSEFRLGISPLFSFKVEIRQTAAGRFSLPLLKTNLSMHSCQVGDSVEAVFHCVSSLAKIVEVDRVKVLLLDVNDYQRLTEADDIVTEADTAFILSTESSIAIQPGQNRITFPWSAMAVGQYVIACICIEWKCATFYHDFTRVPRGVLGFDVLPNDPTQSIELNPIFLIPGHIQNVRLLFHSGSDVVNGGTINFKCSKGLQVMLADSETSNEWKDSCDFSVGRCLPGSTTTVIVSVKSEAIGSYDPTCNGPSGEGSNSSSLQTLKATMTTSYHHGLYASYVEQEKEIDTSPMKALLEASVTTLERAALTIENCGAFSIGDESIVISATVLCNTPVPFSLKEWSISLPPQICLDENGDMNGGLFDSSVIEGEELYFGFRCHRAGDRANVSESSASNPVLTVVLQDHFGKTFRQLLPLNVKSLQEFVMTDNNTEKPSFKVELKANKEEGLIGAPVHFTYDIDCSGIKQVAQELQVRYRISCSETDWIVGGSVRGVLEDFSPSAKPPCFVSFVGIPTKAGYIKKFPRIELTFSQAKSSQISNAPIIKVKQPSPFLCSVHDNVDALACVSTLVDI